MIDLRNGNCLEELEKIKENSIDCIITDPPYELNFMGKGWDNAGVSFNKNTWEKCFRVLKDGGYLLAFGGTRTYHRIACAIEDAGFEIRDCIMWLYGSGFPKSQNIGKMYDKKMGNDREKIGETRIGKTSLGDGSGWDTSQNMKDIKATGKVDVTKGTSKWEGWGSCLKPAYEPIIIARKPFKGSLVDNVIQNGVGGLNIDECRVGNEERTYKGAGGSDITVAKGAIGSGIGKDLEFTVNGRFPANIIHDGSEEVCEGFPSDNKGNSNSRYFYCAKASKKDRDEGLEEFEIVNHAEINNRKEGSAGSERAYGGGTNPFLSVSSPRKNTHPTVKPTELMQYLVRLVAPKGAIILDPFMGSGSTGKAVMYENKERQADYSFIGIEMNKEYCDIARARIEFVTGKQEEETVEKYEQLELV